MIRIFFCSLIAVPALMLGIPVAAQNSARSEVLPATPPTEPATAAPQVATPPIAQPPSTQAPATQAPATQAPATQAPAAQPPAASSPTSATPAPKAVRKGPVDSLKPGQFVWESRSSYANALRMVVVLDIQRMYVFDGDELVGFSTISSGKRGKETPSGIFKILQKKIYHESNIYANAPMPFMQRLTWDGIAIHAGHLPGYPASHGCIRLPRRFAEALYGATQLDGEVVVLESLSKPLARPAPAEPPVEGGTAPVTNPVTQQGAEPAQPTSTPRNPEQPQPQSQTPTPRAGAASRR